MFHVNLKITNSRSSDSLSVSTPLTVPDENERNRLYKMLDDKVSYFLEIVFFSVYYYFLIKVLETFFLF